MTISTTTIKNSYSGNGSTTAFSYTFKITADSEMQVIIRSSTGTETVKTLTTHYTVSGAGDASGGTSMTAMNGDIVLGQTYQSYDGAAAVVGQPTAGQAIYLCEGATSTNQQLFTHGMLIVKFFGHKTF